MMNVDPQDLVFAVTGGFGSCFGLIVPYHTQVLPFLNRNVYFIQLYVGYM